MTKFIYILFYIIVICEIIWLFTSVENKIPLIIKLIISLIALIPGFHIIFGFGFPIFCSIAYEECELRLKNNWFNRKFLGYYE